MWVPVRGTHDPLPADARGFAVPSDPSLDRFDGRIVEGVLEPRDGVAGEDRPLGPTQDRVGQAFLDIPRLPLKG